MAYLYAGLGVALIIPLMALVQTLVSLGSLEGEAGFLRARRLELLNQALLSLEQGLNQAMAAVPPRLQASNVDGNDRVISAVFPACSDLQDPAQPLGAGLESIQWFGDYPNCTVVLAEADPNRSVTRRLRVELGVSRVETGELNRDLPDPVNEVNGSLQVGREALRVRRSCWVSLASQAQECS